MRLVEIREASELMGLKSDWETLLSATPSAAIFLTWEWATAWWSTYGKPGALRVVAAMDDGGVCRGIAPLFFETGNRYGQAFPTLRFMGDGSNDSDYLDCLVSEPHHQEVSAAFCEYWNQQLRRGTVFSLNEVPETSPNLCWLKDLASAGKILYTQSTIPCGTVTLPHTWEGYLAVLKPRFRTKVRSVLRNLGARPDVEFGLCQTPEQVQGLLPVLFDLHTKRWLQAGKPGVFGWDQKRKFYEMLSTVLLKRGWLRFSWLKWNGVVLACQYGFEYMGTYSQLQEGYDPAAEHWNPGVALRAWSIREFIKAGVREYDFLAGMGKHKTDWGAEVKCSAKVLIARDTWKNRLLLYGPEWEERGRSLARRIIPEAILCARHARTEMRVWSTQLLSQNDPALDSRQPGSIRKAAAYAYYYSSLPLVAQFVRKRYAFSITSSGKRGKISCSRRTEACARILSYHRVNDDNDPFFPAISTYLFDQQMRYLSRHYRVLSMSAMLEHLNSSSTEMALAVTLDDGYQDNYHNAFRSLQRYGVPATIFLATGALESGEPLWFERLALGLKTTEREFVDLEIDVPRRFWLRSETERLDANQRIQRLLRGLPDCGRRQQLEETLGLLATKSDVPLRNNMLTWDQIRFMKANGIDFGGHTKSHPFISKLTRDEVFSEVSGCKKRIEEELQSPATFFAYPNGREEDFGMWNKEVIRAAGYTAAVTTIWGTNYRSTDPLELRRGGPWEASMPLFAYKLDWYQLTND